MQRAFTTLLLAALLAATAASADPGAADATWKYDEHLVRELAHAPSVVRVIVTTHGEPGHAADAARDLGGTVTWEYTIIDGFAAQVPTAAIAALAARPDVRGIHLDRPVAANMDLSHRVIEAPRVWETGYTGAGVTVAVLDTGIDVTHPFFAGAIVSCVSTIGGFVSPECTDSDGHGTHVAGTVASRDDTYPGIAPEASLAVVRVLHALGSGTSGDIVAGMNWVQDNQDNVDPPIRVATMSVGFLTPGCGDGTGPEAEAADALVESGLTFTVAAGNAGHNECTIDGASAARNVVTVGAVDDKGTEGQEDDEIAGFSSGGPTADGRLKPDVVYPGVGITSAFIGPLIATMDGTSMATPHTAGVAALLYERDPTLEWTKVKDILLATTVKNAHSGSEPNSVYGHGLGNACQTFGLSTCRELAPPPEPVDAHVEDVQMTWTHQGKSAHRVFTSALVLDDAGAPVAEATVAFRVTSPEGNVYTGTGTTDANGEASYMARQNGGGHGEWQGCVTDVTGTSVHYDEAANVRTCATLTIND